MKMSIDDLQVAVRVYTRQRTDKPLKSRGQQKRKKPTEAVSHSEEAHSAPWPAVVLILDFETTTDPTQRMTFGSYRIGKFHGLRLRVVEEGLVHADDLLETDPQGLALLTAYSTSHKAEVAGRRVKKLHLYSRREFMEKVFWPIAYDAESLVVGFNLPFDISRLATDVGDARIPFRGGFSFQMSEYFDEESDSYKENRNRPRVCVRHLDPRRSFKGFTRPAKVRGDDPGFVVRPEAHPNKGGFRGHLIDLRTLAFALTNTSHSLESACKAFGMEHGKGEAETHGHITPEYIAYNRQDVRATTELLVKLRQEFDLHPISLDPCHAFSPASVGKAYFKAAGIEPLRHKYLNITSEHYGIAMTSYYGGRAEARIRLQPVPVVYGDFLAMYPTVNCLMNMSKMLTAERIGVVSATDYVRRLLRKVSIDQCFDPNFWLKLRFFALVKPRGDILPVRAKYSPDNDSFTIGVNPVTSEDTPLWYAGPDLVASTLLSGRPPEIVEAFRLVPRGLQEGLKPMRLGGQVCIDPRKDDVFQKVIESRKAVARDNSLPKRERERLDRFIKVFANSISYGVYAEFNREEAKAREKFAVEAYGLDGGFTVRKPRLEKPGVYCFPPYASLITSGARLMLALLEATVTRAGGTYAFCDTDSMAIVATKTGGLLACPNGNRTLGDGTPAVQALSWKQVDAIIERFKALNPYDHSVISGSVLEIERENFDDDGRRCQLHVFVISAKRYALFNLAADGTIKICKHSEHGLGHLLNPIDLARESRDWIQEVWLEIITSTLNGTSPSFPSWASRPAVSRLSITSPHLYRPFHRTGSKLKYADRIKPMNFVLSVTVAPFGHPPGVDPKRFHLIGPYTTDPRKIRRQFWFDIHTGERFGITTGHPGGSLVRVQSYNDILVKYCTHPESKSADATRKACTRSTKGLLYRRSVVVNEVVYIGKEANRIEEVEHGTVHDWEEVRERYSDPKRGIWVTHVFPILRTLEEKVLAKRIGVTARTMRSYRSGTSRPRMKTFKSAALVAVERARHIVGSAEFAVELRRRAERLLATDLARSIEIPEVQAQTQDSQRRVACIRLC